MWKLYYCVAKKQLILLLGPVSLNKMYRKKIPTIPNGLINNCVVNASFCKRWQQRVREQVPEAL
jgi:hypothetical protein